MKKDFNISFEKIAIDNPLAPKPDQSTQIDFGVNEATNSLSQNLYNYMNEAAQSYTLYSTYENYLNQLLKSFNDIKSKTILPNSGSAMNAENPCSLMTTFGGADKYFSKNDFTQLQKLMSEYQPKCQNAFNSFISSFNAAYQFMTQHANEEYLESQFQKVSDPIGRIMSSPQAEGKTTAAGHIFRVAASPQIKPEGAPATDQKNPNSNVQQASNQTFESKTQLQNMTFYKNVLAKMDNLKILEYNNEMLMKNIKNEPIRSVYLFDKQKTLMVYLRQLCQVYRNFMIVNSLNKTLKVPGLGLYAPAMALVEGYNHVADLLVDMANDILNFPGEQDASGKETNQAWAEQFYNAAGEMSQKAQEIYFETMGKIAPME